MYAEWIGVRSAASGRPSAGFAGSPEPFFKRALGDTRAASGHHDPPAISSYERYGQRSEPRSHRSLAKARLYVVCRRGVRLQPPHAPMTTGEEQWPPAEVRARASSTASSPAPTGSFRTRRL